MPTDQSDVTGTNEAVKTAGHENLQPQLYLKLDFQRSYSLEYIYVLLSTPSLLH